VLFLFVIMLLGVDYEQLRTDNLPIARPLAVMGLVSSACSSPPSCRRIPSH
jgi:hypothetical protein